MQVNECCDELRKRNVKSILGNHDWHLISGTLSRSGTANKCLDFQRKIITNENLDWISSFPVFRKTGDLSMVHGGWSNPIDEYMVDPANNYFESIPGNFFASGHTHKQVLRNFDTKAYCNPGSVGQPRDGDNRAAFALFNGTEFELNRVPYDIDEICGLMSKAGFSEYFYNRLYTGAEHFS
jgi:predicted phosphodiesterase